MRTLTKVSESPDVDLAQLTRYAEDVVQIHRQAGVLPPDMLDDHLSAYQAQLAQLAKSRAPPAAPISWRARLERLTQ